MMVVATLATVALPGCILEPGHSYRDDRGHSDAHVSVGASVEIEHSYIYYPSQHAYYCESCNEWWVMGSGGWVSTTARPPRVEINEQTTWVVVNVKGPQPQVQYAEHARDYPEDWKPRESKGPPPGRGWRK
jgi:hypothetical protein